MSRSAAQRICQFIASTILNDIFTLVLDNKPDGLISAISIFLNYASSQISPAAPRRFGYLALW
jgi:hypothetical protein